MAWHFEHRVLEAISPSRFSRQATFVVNCEEHVVVDCRVSRDGWFFLVASPLATFKFEESSARTGASLTDLPGPVCTINIERQESLERLTNEQRKKVAGLAKEILLNLHVLPSSISKGRRVESVKFWPRTATYLNVSGE